MASRTIKIIVSSAAFAVLVTAGFVASSIYGAWHKFATEDHIHAVFYSVAIGLGEFQKDTGSAARELSEITPKYIAEIPKLDLVDKIGYSRSSDGQNWELSLYSTALNPPRYYVVRSNQKYTESEEKKVILRYHSIWTVLKE